MRFYAGIGSRETPVNILSDMHAIAIKLSERGWILRSGGARGADSAFERGASNNCCIFTANDATQESIDYTAQFHPAWNKCSGYAKLLHARNAMIILGEHLDDPVKFVICWTPDGKDSGGTGQAIRIARHNKIPIYNLFDGPINLIITP